MGREEDMRLASWVLSAGFWLLLLRLVCHDGVGLIVRQPISYFLCFAQPRLFELYIPYGSWFRSDSRSLATFFDGDATPALFLAVLAALASSGGLCRTFLWPLSGKPGWKRRRCMAFTVFFLVPLAWGLSILRAYQLAKDIETSVHRAFPAVDTGAFELDSALDWWKCVNNDLWHPENARANLSVIYKTVPDASASSTCSESKLFALPGDGFFIESRQQMVKGELVMDVHYLAGSASKRRPIVLHIHGGGWNKGTRSFLKLNYRGGMPFRLLQKGHVIASISYRLSCTGLDSRFGMLADIQDALTYIKAHGHEWGGDGNRVILWGTSAGGNLVLNTAFRAPLHPQVVGVIAHYAPVELREKDLAARGDRLDSAFARFHAKIFIDETRHVCAGAEDQQAANRCFEEMSPLYHLEQRLMLTKNKEISSLPPTLLIHGEADPLVPIEHAQWAANALSKLGVRHALVKTLGSHDCDVIVSSPCGQATWFSIERLLHFLQAD